MFSFMSFSSVEAKAKVKTYKNCTALNKDYRGGFAKSKSTKNKGGKRSTNHMFLKLYMMQTKKRP